MEQWLEDWKPWQHQNAHLSRDPQTYARPYGHSGELDQMSLKARCSFISHGQRQTYLHRPGQRGFAGLLALNIETA